MYPLLSGRKFRTPSFQYTGWGAPEFVVATTPEIYASFVAVLGVLGPVPVDAALQATIPAKTSTMTPKSKILLMKSSCALNRLQKGVHSGDEGRVAPLRVKVISSSPCACQHSVWK